METDRTKKQQRNHTYIGGNRILHGIKHRNGLLCG